MNKLELYLSSQAVVAFLSSHVPHSQWLYYQGYLHAVKPKSTSATGLGTCTCFQCIVFSFWQMLCDDVFGRNLFSRKQREAQSAPGWKLFGKVPLRESPPKASKTIQQVCLHLIHIESRRKFGSSNMGQNVIKPFIDLLNSCILLLVYMKSKCSHLINFPCLNVHNFLSVHIILKQKIIIFH